MNEIQVKIADYKIVKGPDKLITLGLGSCIGITFHSPIMKIGGMAHIMLPDSTQFNKVTNIAKFADLALPAMLEQMLRMGVTKASIQAKIAGGAQMFNYAAEKAILDIGKRNAVAVKDQLSKLGIKLIAEQVGGNKGRTMIFDTQTGSVTIRTIGSALIEM